MYIFYEKYYNALIFYPKTSLCCVWCYTDLIRSAGSLKMKTSEYDYYCYYLVETHTVYLAQQKEGELYVSVFLKIFKCEVKSIGVKSSQRQCILNGYIRQKARKGPGIKTQ